MMVFVSTQILQSSPSPLWGGIKGGGEPQAQRSLPHPTPALPIEGREFAPSEITP